MSNPIARPKHMSDFESLIEKNNIKYTDRWKPTSVCMFEHDLSYGNFTGMKRELRKNIAYSLQYLQYLQLQLSEIKLHDIIATHLLKTYIITAMSIIESIFFHLLKLNDSYKKEDWKAISVPIHTNQFIENGVTKKHVITTLEKVEPYDGEMDFEAMINRIQNKKLLNVNHKVFPHIKALKRLRNKVHLHIIKHDNDTDYYKINFKDYILARYILYKILTADAFHPEKQNQYFDFIYPLENQIDILKNELDTKKQKEPAND